MLVMWISKGEWYKNLYFLNTSITVNNWQLEQTAATNRKVILDWSSSYKPSHLGAGDFAICPVSNCLLTNNRSQVSLASAILFHFRQLRKPPRYRNSKQLYVFLLRESPSYTRWNIQQRYNLTMTYRRDSDIPIPVSEIVRKTAPVSAYRIKFPFANRTRSVAWVVSHCKTASKRENYVRKLQQYIDVDIYGKCWNNSHPVCKSVDRFCLTEAIPANYKFYLAFENSLCKDYVTEKLFRPLLTEIVPIVYGGTNYSRDAPPHSVINVADYSSPEKLAKYLKQLASNEPEYNSYFEWKKSYEFMSTSLPKGFCKLCEIVNSPTFHKTYRNMKSWWSHGKCKMPIRV